MCQNNNKVHAGELVFGYTWVDAINALWTFDIKQQEWQHRQSTGCLPEPALCCGMAVVGDCAYVLVNHHNDYCTQRPSEPHTERHMEMYVLDLKTWHWEQLPTQADGPYGVRHIAPAVVQVREHHQEFQGRSGMFLQLSHSYRCTQT